MIKKKFDELRLTGKLPSPSFVGLRVLDLTQRDDYLLEELTKTISADPALSGRLIKLANAVDRDGLDPVETVEQAAMRLGPKTVRTVALGVTFVSDNRSGVCEAFDYEQFWSLALAAAVSAKVLARVKKIFEPAEAFTCALLCDIGKLALASVHPKTYSDLHSRNPGATDRELSDLELRAFDINHAEIGAAMLSDWGLPSVFEEAVLVHELETDSVHDESGSTWALVTLLRAGKRIAKILATERSLTQEDWRRNFFALSDVAGSLGLEPEELYEICDEINQEWGEWGAMITIRTREPYSFSETATELESSEPGQESSNSESSIVSLLGMSELEAALRVPTRVLLIDDDQRMVRLIEHHLKREAYDVVTAASSGDGLQKALDLNPQIIITDWMMPGMSGLKLCETLRLTEAGRKMYILVVTAREMDEQVIEAFSAGADDYVVKPFNPRIFLARVKAGQRMIRMREHVEDSERERLRQVAELGILARRLQAAATTDALTELPNRRYAIKRLKQEWDNAIRTGRQLSVCMLDIDHFKKVNDVYGHDAGDAVLRQTAQVLRSKTRSGDVLARLGGEEFLSINIGCDAEQALVCAERLRVAMEETTIMHEGFQLNVTVSLGIAERAQKMVSIDDLLKAADETLYEAKEGGRNVSRVAVPATEVKTG